MKKTKICVYCKSLDVVGTITVKGVSKKDGKRKQKTVGICENCLLEKVLPQANNA